MTENRSIQAAPAQPGALSDDRLDLVSGGFFAELVAALRSALSSSSSTKDLQSQDKLGNFEIQGL